MNFNEGIGTGKDKEGHDQPDEGNSREDQSGKRVPKCARNLVRGLKRERKRPFRTAKGSRRGGTTSKRKKSCQWKKRRLGKKDGKIQVRKGGKKMRAGLHAKSGFTASSRRLGWGGVLRGLHGELSRKWCWGGTGMGWGGWGFFGGKRGLVNSKNVASAQLFLNRR